MNLDRETIASAIVGTGGAWMIGSALFNGRNGRWNAAEVQGLAYSGIGFLVTAAAARWLQHTGPRGMVLSVLGHGAGHAGHVFAAAGAGRAPRAREAAHARVKPRAAA